MRSLTKGGFILDTIDKVRKFRAERNWQHVNMEKDLALSINLEASELLELFQWQSSQDAVVANKKAMTEELADVIIYAYMLADNLSVDIDDIVSQKLSKNAKRYPAKELREHPENYSHLRQQSRNTQLKK